jgi:Protein of unknown function (DUF1360)
VARLAQIGRDEAAEYRGDSTQPVASHAALLGVYLVLLAIATLLARAAGRELPEEVSVKDLVTMALGTHKISRAITKESVASPVRAPFTHHNGQGGPAEVMDEPRGEGGMRHAVGELLTCPFCLGVWVGTAYVAGLVVAPRPTRAVAAVFSVVAVSDWLQHGYSRLRGD